MLEETARLLTDLADIETKKGTAITACIALSKEREQVKLVCPSSRISKDQYCWSSIKRVSLIGGEVRNNHVTMNSTCEVDNK